MKDAYQEMTDRLVALVDDAGEWRPPWRRSGLAHPVNAVTKKRYRGVNVFMCWAAAMENGHSSSRWATFNQWKEIDCAVRKGERGTPIIFFKEYEKEGEGGPEKHIVSRMSYVFNANQVTGERAADAEPERSAAPVARSASIDSFIHRTHAVIEHVGGSACYIPALDQIRMPKVEDFFKTERYYSTLFHELAHWSGAKPRLDRNLSTRFGSDAYAAEEMVAEMSAAFLSAEFGIENHTRDDHAAYLKSWLALAKADKRALVTAAAQASKAADYLIDLAHIDLMAEMAA
jgi:antirestriction protein ArdC